MTNIEQSTSTRSNPFPHIVQTPGYVDGEPRIDGTGIGVRHVVQVNRFDGGVAAVVRAFPHISESQAREALAYYAAHTDEIDRYIAENDC